MQNGAMGNRRRKRMDSRFDQFMHASDKIDLRDHGETVGSFRERNMPGACRALG